MVINDIHFASSGSYITKHCIEQVSYQIQGPVSDGDDGVFGEDDGLASVPWHGELGEDDAGHASLDDHAQDALEGHNNDGEWTLLCRRSERKVKQWLEFSG